MSTNIGRLIDERYRIDELVGSGGMAYVYKATDVTDGKTVAVKVLKPEFYDNTELTRRFKNESKAIALLSHPNIIRVFDVSFTDEMKCIVMEYIDGITLKEYLEMQGAISWKETVFFGGQILSAVAHAHKKGIIHRDLKPQNILLLSDGTIKIMDFGIARFARSETRTITDKAIGSVHYISPEQARGEATDQRSDIYSMGVIFYEMLTGRLPFDADSPVSVAIKQIELDAPLPTAINREIPQGLEDIILRAMQKDPSYRYQNVEQMIEDIENFKRDPSIHFAYKYIEKPTNQTEGRYQSAINTNRKVTKTKQPQTATQERRSAESSRSIIPVLAGITAAFVLVTGIFIATMFYLNNPFEKVADILVPDLMGLKYDAVRDAEMYKNFIIEVEETDFNELYGEGEIFYQSPKAGKNVKVNSKIKVKVSTGQKVIEVPNVIGMEETLAYGRLVERDLKYSKSTIFSNTTPAGMVVATEPGPGSKVGAGAEIKLQISMGPENAFVPVPDLKGMTKEQAASALEELGLQLGGVTYVISAEQEGMIVSQDPSFGNEIAVGTYVNVNISGASRSGSTVELAVPMPNKDKLMKIQAMVDGTIIKEETINPSMAGYWRPSFEGSGTDKVFILIDGFLYQVYKLDFTNGTSTLVEDNAANLG